MRDSFNDLTYEELHTKREELKSRYQNILFNKVVGHVDNPLEKRTLRRQIARANTIIHEYDLGLRQVLQTLEVSAASRPSPVFLHGRLLPPAGHLR